MKAHALSDGDFLLCFSVPRLDTDILAGCEGSNILDEIFEGEVPILALLGRKRKFRL